MSASLPSDVAILVATIVIPFVLIIILHLVFVLNNIPFLLLIIPLSEISTRKISGDLEISGLGKKSKHQCYLSGGIISEGSKILMTMEEINRILNCSLAFLTKDKVKPIFYYLLKFTCQRQNYH